MISDQPVEGAPTRHVDVPIAVHIDDRAVPHTLANLEYDAEEQTDEVDQLDELDELDQRNGPADAAKHRARRALPFTSVAFLTALALLITQGVAINLASSGSQAAATTIAQLLIWLTVIPFVLAVIALVRGPHRGWAIASMIVSVIANPIILRLVLSFFGSLQ